MEYSCNGKSLTFHTPHVMAVINLTPDSFYDGGKFDNTNDVLRDAEEKVRSGASILDLGAVSSRPGAAEISEEEEAKRLFPALKLIRKEFPSTFISIDTFRSKIAVEAVQLGGDIINDISGGNGDEEMLRTVSELNVPYVLMHMQGTPATMQLNPRYEDVKNEVLNFFNERIGILDRYNFKKIILDPGFGFGKNVSHNYTLLKELPLFRNMGYPVLAGFSRKSMINKIIGTNPVTSLNGTTVLNTIALLNGASILRVHDVTEARQAVELVQYYKNN